MLRSDDLLQLINRLGLERALELIHTIRSSEPTRRVRSVTGNVSGTFPSPKMGFTVQFESHRNELAHILQYEHDKDVLEFWDQPCKIPLEYLSARGRRVCIMHTPDFFVIRRDSAGFEECKPEELLPTLASDSPNRFMRDSNGIWRCPPGEQFAETLGLYYSVRSSAEINRIYYRNMIFLDDFFRKGARNDR